MVTYSEYTSETFKMILDKYLLRCRSGRTAGEYAGYVRLLCDALCKDYLDVTEDEAEELFIRWKNKGLARRTLRTRLSCYNSIAKFIQEEIDSLEFINPFEHVIRPDVSDDIKPQKIPSMAQMDKIMTQARAEGYMWYVILALVSRACLSPTKVTQITRTSIYRENDSVGLYFKDKSAVILPKDVSELLDKYLSMVSIEDSAGHIFYNKHGRALTLKNLDTGVAKIIENAGIEEKFTLINIRSRAILELAKAGVDEVTLANYANIGAMRTRQFVEAKSLIGTCPADLVNYRLCESAI